MKQAGRRRHDRRAHVHTCWHPNSQYSRRRNSLHNRPTKESGERCRVTWKPEAEQHTDCLGVPCGAGAYLHVCRRRSRRKKTPDRTYLQQPQPHHQKASDALVMAKKAPPLDKQTSKCTLSAKRLVSSAFQPDVSSTATFSAPLMASLIVSFVRSKFVLMAPDNLSRKKAYAASPVHSAASPPCPCPCPKDDASPALVRAPRVLATRERTLGSACSRCWSHCARSERRNKGLRLWPLLSTKF